MAYYVLEAYSFISDYAFPINISKLINNVSNVKLETYSNLAKLTGTSIFDICRMLGSDDGTTFFDTKTNRYVIAYNDKIGNSSRIRFTIVHELGHIYLKHLLNEKDKAAYEKQEKEANYFAKRLLVPLPFLTETLNQTKLPKLTVDDIAWEFDVSLDVAKYSIKNYNELPFTPNDESLCSPFRDMIKSRVSIIELVHRLSA